MAGKNANSKNVDRWVQTIGGGCISGRTWSWRGHLISNTFYAAHRARTLLPPRSSPHARCHLFARTSLRTRTSALHAVHLFAHLSAAHTAFLCAHNAHCTLPLRQRRQPAIMSAVISVEKSKWQNQ
jgi:hypothetical protein